MTEMKDFFLRLPTAMHAEIKRRADTHSRSINGEMLVLLQRALGEAAAPMRDAVQARLVAVKRARPTREALRAMTHRLREMMPMDRDLQDVCAACEAMLEVWPQSKHERGAKKLEAARKKVARRDYQRRWMAAKRAQSKNGHDAA